MTTKYCGKCDSTQNVRFFGKDRSTKDGLTTCCKTCRAAMSAAWRANNPEKVTQGLRNYYEANADKVRAKALKESAEKRSTYRAGEYAEIQRQWREANPERVRQHVRTRVQSLGRVELAARQRRDRADNPDRYAAYAGKKRAKRLKRFVPWADRAEIEKVYAEARRLTIETGVLHHVDHEYPLQGKLVSGLHVHQNLCPIPASINMAKGNKYTPEVSERG